MRNKFDEEHILSLCDSKIRYDVTSLRPMEAQVAVDELRRYFLGEDWYDTSGVTNTEQVNTNIVAEIEIKYRGARIGFFKYKKFDSRHIWNLCDTDNREFLIFSPPMRAEIAICELSDYFLGDGWRYGLMGNKNINTIIVVAIEKKYKGCRIKKRR